MHKAADLHNHWVRAAEEIIQSKAEMGTHLKNHLKQYNTLHRLMDLEKCKGVKDAMYQKMKSAAFMVSQSKEAILCSYRYINLSINARYDSFNCNH